MRRRRRARARPSPRTRPPHGTWPGSARCRGTRPRAAGRCAAPRRSRRATPRGRRSGPPAAARRAAAIAVSRCPGPGSTRAGPSPSHVAVPSSPTARQAPVHEVSKPSAAQLPSNAKRTPSLISNTACAAAGPGVPAPRRVVGLAVDRQRARAGDRPGAVEQVDGHVEQQRLGEREQELGGDPVRAVEVARDAAQRPEARDRLAEGLQARQVAPVLADREQPAACGRPPRSSRPPRAASRPSASPTARRRPPRARRS